MFALALFAHKYTQDQRDQALLSDPHSGLCGRRAGNLSTAVVSHSFALSLPSNSDSGSSPRGVLGGTRTHTHTPSSRFSLFFLSSSFFVLLISSSSPFSPPLSFILLVCLPSYLHSSSLFSLKYPFPPFFITLCVRVREISSLLSRSAVYPFNVSDLPPRDSLSLC